MKKILIFLLTISVLFPNTTPVFAKSEEPNDDTIILVRDELNNNYSVVEEQAMTSNSKDNVIAKQTDDEDIYALSDGTYVARFNSDVFIATQKVDIYLSTVDELNSVLDKYDIRDEVKKGLLKVQSEFEQGLLEDNHITVYIPNETYKSNNMIDSQSMGTQSYSGYKGFQYDVYYSYYNKATPTSEIYGGATADDLARGLATALVYGASIYNPTFGIVSGAASAVASFKSSIGVDPVTGTSSDQVEIKVSYTETEKYTYILEGQNWLLGCKTTRVYIKNTLLTQFYANYNNGRAYTIDQTHNKYYYSKNWFNHEEKAYYGMYNTWIDSSIRLKVGNLTMYMH